jgi:hypothetical protein
MAQPLGHQKLTERKSEWEFDRNNRSCYFEKIRRSCRSNEILLLISSNVKPSCWALDLNCKFLSIFCMVLAFIRIASLKILVDEAIGGLLLQSFSRKDQFHRFL